MRSLIFSLVLFVLASGNLFSTEIKGDTLRINGTKVLKVYGNHNERGYAYGNLLAKEIYSVYNNYFVENAMQPLIPYYSTLKSSFIQTLVISDKYLDEAKGIVAGINSTEYKDEFYAIWGRDLVVGSLLPYSSKYSG